MTTPLNQLGYGGAGLTDGTLKNLLNRMVIAVDFTDPAAASTTAVHAARAGNNATNLFPGPITNPAIPRNLTATAAASYDGGALTIVGTDQFNRVITEVITPVPSSTVVGNKAFKTVTSITKAAVGANAATVSVGTGVKLGLPVKVKAPVHSFAANGTAEAGTLDVTNQTITPTTAPNGTNDYKLMVSPA